MGEIDVTANQNLQLQIEKETPAKEFPIFYENDSDDNLKPIGTIDDLRQWYQNYRLQYVNELTEIESSFEIIEETTHNLSAGYIGGTLDTLEWIVRGSTNLLSPSTWFSWGSSSNTENSKILEFPVIQTNWYWRQQKRILRFTEDGIEKVHPITNEIRSKRAYSALESLVVTNGIFLNFTFLEDLLKTVHEYYQVSPSITNTLIQRLLLKIPKLPVHYDTE